MSDDDLTPSPRYQHLANELLARLESPVGLGALGESLQQGTADLHLAESKVESARVDAAATAEDLLNLSINRILHVAIYLREVARTTQATIPLVDSNHTRGLILHALARASQNLSGIAASLQQEEENHGQD